MTDSRKEQAKIIEGRVISCPGCGTQNFQVPGHCPSCNSFVLDPRLEVQDQENWSQYEVIGETTAAQLINQHPALADLWPNLYDTKVFKKLARLLTEHSGVIFPAHSERRREKIEFFTGNNNNLAGKLNYDEPEDDFAIQLLNKHQSFGVGVSLLVLQLLDAHQLSTQKFQLALHRLREAQQGKFTPAANFTSPAQIDHYIPKAEEPEAPEVEVKKRTDRRLFKESDLFAYRLKDRECADEMDFYHDAVSRIFQRYPEETKELILEVANIDNKQERNAWLNIHTINYDWINKEGSALEFATNLAENIQMQDFPHPLMLAQALVTTTEDYMGRHSNYQPLKVFNKLEKFVTNVQKTL